MDDIVVGWRRAADFDADLVVVTVHRLFFRLLALEEIARQFVALENHARGRLPVAPGQFGRANDVAIGVPGAVGEAGKFGFSRFDEGRIDA